MAAKTIQGHDPISGAFIEILIESGGSRSITPAVYGEDLRICLGFIDLQVNGYAGYDPNAESTTPGLVTDLMNRLLAVVVTTFLPTLTTASGNRSSRRCAPSLQLASVPQR